MSHLTITSRSPCAGPDGLPTTQKLWDTITGNLVIANYNSMAALGAWRLGVVVLIDRVVRSRCLAYASADHDDASAYYNCTNNVFSYSPFGLVRLNSLFNILPSHRYIYPPLSLQKSDFGGHDNHHSYSVYAYLRDTSWFDGPAMIWVSEGNRRRCVTPKTSESRLTPNNSVRHR